METRTHKSRTRLESELPHSRSRDQHSVGGHPREVKRTVTPSEGKDSDSSDSRKTFIILKQEGRRGLNEVVPGTSVFPLSETGLILRCAMKVGNPF